MKAFACFEKPLAACLVAVLSLIMPVAAAAEAPVPGASPNGVMVTVTRATNACFSDLVRVTGFIVPRREAVVNVDTEGAKVSDVMVKEGESVNENQELARLTPPSAPGAAKPAPVSLRAPAAGLITQVATVAGAPASPQAPPMFRIAVNNEVEFDAEVPSIQILKLNTGATARISRDDQGDVFGKVRLISPQIDRATQLGHVRLSVSSSPPLKIGTFARANIDAKRSCDGVAVPRSAIDHLTVQVVKGTTIETRRVRVGLTSDTATQILEGINVGDVVVADAGSSLHDGDQIKTTFADDLDRSRVQ